MTEPVKYNRELQVAVLSLAVAIGAFLYSPIARYFDDAADIPNAKYVSTRLENGTSVLTIQNTSATTDLPIVRTSYEITDTALLDRIALLDPRPTTTSSNQFGTQNVVNDVYFSSGHWEGHAKYIFEALLGMHIPKGAVEDIRPAFDGYRWNQTFTGTLILHDGNERVLRIPDVRIGCIRATGEENP